MALSAGSLIPANGIVLDAHDFLVNQAVLTGETRTLAEGIVSLDGAQKTKLDVAISKQSNQMAFGGPSGSRPSPIVGTGPLRHRP